MPMSPAAQQIVADWLTQKIPQLTCPACNGRKFEGADLVVAVRVRDYAPGPVHVHLGAGQHVRLAPLVPLVCLDCGHVLLFSATVLGVAPHAS
jgi:hypothetical protein